MATYTIRKNTPDAFELGTMIKQSRRALEIATEDIAGEVWNIRNKVDLKEIEAINESMEVLHLIIRSLEDLEAGADALGGVEARERHFSYIMGLLEKKPEERSKGEQLSLEENGIVEEGRTVTEIMAEYRAKVEAQDGVQN